MSVIETKQLVNSDRDLIYPKTNTDSVYVSENGETTETSLTEYLDILNGYVSRKADKTSVVTISGTSVKQELADNTVYQCSELSSLTITMPNVVTPDYISQINFASGTAATTLTAPNNIVWFGDDITNGVFVPTADKQYIVMLYSDGVNARGIVQYN